MVIMVCKRIFRPSLALLSLLVLVHLTSCSGGLPAPVCPEDSDGITWQLSPSGRGVAMIDEELFGNMITLMSEVPNSTSIATDCIPDEFASRYSNQVDFVFVVMNISGSEFINYDPELHIANYSSQQREFDTGIGTRSLSSPEPVGPDSMRSYIFLRNREALRDGPSLHEIAHAWSAFLVGPDALARQLQRDPPGHWGFTSVGGELGGWDASTLQELGGGRYRACKPDDDDRFLPEGYSENDLPYAPLELYLMGLIGPDEVPDTQVAVNPYSSNIFHVSFQAGHCTEFSADDVVTVTIDEIIAANGLRMPDVTESPKDFTAAVVVVSDEPLTEDEWDDIEVGMNCLEETDGCVNFIQTDIGIIIDTNRPFVISFQEATGGRATLEFVELTER